MSSSTRITTYHSLHIQLVQNAPDDGPLRSETCRSETQLLIKTYSVKPHCVSRWTRYIYYKNDTRTLQCQVSSYRICGINSPPFSSHSIPLSLSLSLNVNYLSFTFSTAVLTKFSRRRNSSIFVISAVFYSQLCVKTIAIRLLPDTKLHRRTKRMCKRLALRDTKFYQG